MDSVEHFETTNIAEVCRACFETCDHYKLLFEQSECIENRTLGDVFLDVVKISIDASAETLPSRICFNCLGDLITAYNFIQKSQKSNQRLVKLLRNPNFKQTDFLTGIKIEDDSDNENTMNDVQIKTEKEIPDDYNDSMEYNNSSINSCDLEMSETLGHTMTKHPKLQCQYCKQIFKKQNLYENHIRTHRAENQKKKGESEDGNKLKCNVCDFSCDSNLEMRKHKQTNHTPRRVRGQNKRKIGLHTEEQMKNAMKQITNGMSIRAAAINESLKYATVRRYWNKMQLGVTRLVPNYNINRVFTDEQEQTLKSYILQCSQIYYGLKTKDVRKLAYEIANKNKIAIPNSWHRDQMAGLEFLRSFRQRHKDISPEILSSIRNTAFDKRNIDNFCNNLEELYQRSPIFSEGTRVFHLYEILTSTVRKQEKFLDKTSSSLCKGTSDESDSLVNTCCIISATGNALPPAIVFPQMNVEHNMTKNAPLGALGLASPTGLMNSTLFVDVIKHFIKKSDSSYDNPSIFIYGNSEFHYSIEALDCANNAGVYFLTLPPQITGKVHPFFAAFESSYFATCDSWMMKNPDQPPSIFDVAGTIGIAHDKCLTPTNIINSFKITGIYPFNRDILMGNSFILNKQLKLNEDTYQSLTIENKEIKTEDDHGHEHSEVFNSQLQVEYILPTCTVPAV